MRPFQICNKWCLCASWSLNFRSILQRYCILTLPHREVMFTYLKFLEYDFITLHVLLLTVTFVHHVSNKHNYPTCAILSIKYMKIMELNSLSLRNNTYHLGVDIKIKKLLVAILECFIILAATPPIIVLSGSLGLAPRLLMSSIQLFTVKLIKLTDVLTYRSCSIITSISFYTSFAAMTSNCLELGY